MKSKRKDWKKVLSWLRTIKIQDSLRWRIQNYWTIDNIGKESMKYNSRSEFRKYNQWAYENARRLGILDALYPNLNNRNEYF